MRETEFRAWVRPGKMQYGVVPFKWDFCIDKMYTKCIESTGNGLFDSGGYTAKWELGGFRYVEEAENNLMQYTGLKDKNGKELYEGDIFSHNNRNFQIIFSENKLVLLARLIGTGKNTDKPSNWRDLEWVNNVSKHIEIIGNIYENPELLTPPTGDNK